MGPEIIVPLGFFTMVTALGIGIPLVRAYTRRLDKRSVPSVPPEVQQRLERMENAIDSIAVEVERISEGQRFTMKLLAERQKEAPTMLSASDTERR